MNFVEAKDYLLTLYSFEKERKVSQRKKGFTLDHYKDFLSKIDNPQDSLKYIHVAGSKGKGSTCNFIASGLASQNLKVGLFTSPAIKDLREQISVNGEWISEQNFAELVFYIKSKLEKFKLEISYFEFINTIAFLYFSQQKVNFAVLEVGLGGLYDSTNVINPVLTVLTSVELEHTDILGKSIQEILANKLGIMKSDVPMFVSKQQFDVKSQINEKADSLNVEVIYVDNEYHLESIDLQGTSFDGHVISLIGEPYIYSVKTAYEVCRYILPNFDELKFWQAVKGLVLPGRFEIFRDEGETIVFDMAHTVQGAKFLRKGLESVFPDSKFVFLISMMKDKNVKNFSEALFKPNDEVIITKASIDRSMDVVDLSSQIKQRVTLFEDPKEAFDFARHKKEILVCTGSHFLLYDLYPLVKSN